MKQTLTPAQTRQAAARILDLTRRQLAREVPALMLPLYLFRDCPLDQRLPPSTDGCRLFYSPERLIADFRADRDLPARQLMHVLLHCLLGHLPQRRGQQDPALFDALADCRVQSVMDTLHPRLRIPPEEGEDIIRALLRDQSFPSQKQLLRPMPEVYRAAREDRQLAWDAIKKGARCMLDCHGMWEPAAAVALLSDTRSDEEKPGQGQRYLTPGLGGPGKAGRREPPSMPDWQGIMKGLLEQTGWGALPGGLRDAFDPGEENRISYREFLRRFAVPRERLLTDPDGLDHRWYCLGLELYGDIPLIEPPELSEPPVPDQLVIALDTSGSCAGDTARRFLRETLNLLRDIFAGAGRFQLLLLQCDTQIQQEVWLESAGQVDTLGEVFEPRGFGGTDFRPVFRRVKQLREEGKLSRVQGLLYLSDGWGDYPDTPPDYPVAFLIPGKERNCCVSRPSWLTVLYLDPNEFTVEEASE